jgi:RNA polymerase sigma factor (sigma-70 family)
MAKPNFKTLPEDEAKKFIFEHIKKRFTKNGPIIGKLPRDYREDALNEIYIDLWNNRFNYNPSLADFTTYAYNRGRGVIKAMLQSSGRITRIRKKISKENRCNSLEKTDTFEGKEFCGKLLSVLTEEERKIMTMRFVESVHIEDIAENLNLNPQKIYSIIRDAKMKCIRSKWNQK